MNLDDSIFTSGHLRTGFRANIAREQRENKNSKFFENHAIFLGLES